ncbi:MAG TPA: macro domain-containing protein [Ktedonobacteraceae bacterium]
MAHIQYIKGDIFNSRAQVIVNTVNCQGVMGKGLALAFKQRYPDMFAVYERDCQTGKLKIGRPTIYQKSSPWILNFPTKNHWRHPSKLEYIEKGLAFLANNYKRAGIISIAFPKLGAQNGKLEWDDVGPIMAKYLNQLDIDVYIYIAEGDKEYQYDQLEDIRIHKRIWQNFSEIALSADKLSSEVGLSSREAKKVADARLKADFTSLASIESIDKIAKASVNKIKKFVEKHNMTELVDVPEKDMATKQGEKMLPKPPKKKRKATINSNATANVLFSI